MEIKKFQKKKQINSNEEKLPSLFILKGINFKNVSY